ALKIPTASRLPVPALRHLSVSAGQDSVSLSLEPSDRPLADEPVLRVYPDDSIRFGLVNPNQPYQKQFLIENQGSEPLQATITSDSPAVLLDVEAVQENRARITVWLKPFALDARHYESEITVASNGGTEALDVWYTVARSAVAGRSLPVAQQDQRVAMGMRDPMRLIAFVLGLMWLLCQLMIHWGPHAAGPWMGH